MWRSAIDRVLYQDLPSICRLLKRIQIESDQIVEEVALNLASKHVDLAAKNIEGVSISTGRAWASWERS
jgi:hypothetical protein